MVAGGASVSPGAWGARNGRTSKRGAAHTGGSELSQLWITTEIHTFVEVTKNPANAAQEVEVRSAFCFALLCVSHNFRFAPPHPFGQRGGAFMAFKYQDMTLPYVIAVIELVRSVVVPFCPEKEK